MNLVTGVTSLAFNPTTEILAVASEKMKEAVRLVIYLYPFLFSLLFLKFKFKTWKDMGKKSAVLLLKKFSFDVEFTSVEAFGCVRGSDAW